MSEGAAAIGACIASFISRDGTLAVEAENLAASSVPRGDQRPCSTQNEAIGTRPDFGGSSRLTIKRAVLLAALHDVAGLHEHSACRRGFRCRGS